jgi:2,4-dienoyl-CoA reductase-like NADH-dependent reductase (Old Yellow Enzyme family)
MNIQPIFEPYTLNNGVRVDNRLVVAPMTHWASDAQGHITDMERSFLQNRAEGFGLFITAATLVSPEGKAFAGEPEAIDEGDLDSLKATASFIKSQGAKAILQLHHGGRQAVGELLGGLDRVAPSSDSEVDGVPQASDGVRAMTTAEINDVIAAFGRATELAIEAGFDGVEIHGANGYLLQQFFSGHTNRRTDEWGGSLDKRMRFPLAVVDAVMAARDRKNRPDFIVGYRFSPEEPEERGLTMTDTFALIDALLETPLQYLHVSLHNFFAHARRGADTAQQRTVLLHEHIAGRLPLIGVGGLLTAEDIDRAWATGSAEFLALGRAVLLNPNLVELLRKGQYDRIATELDPTRPDRYRFSETLWQLNLQGLDFLPKVKR